MLTALSLLLLAPLHLVGTSAAAGADPAQSASDHFDLGQYDLIRVDQPDHPDAIATSATGSVLLSPPEQGPWWVEEIPAIDMIDAADLLDGDDRTDSTLVEADSKLAGVGTWRAWDADAAMHVSAWHDAGIDGSRGGDPVRVAVFDVQWSGAEALGDELGEFTTHDCWRHRGCGMPIDTLRPQFAWELGSHGVGCAEVVRDLAPGVELHLVRVNSVTALENAIDWAIREGIEVVTMSMSFFNNSFYDGSGRVGELMDRMAAGDVLLVTSAGNYAEQHWRGPFRDDDGDGIHQFSDDRRTLPIYLRSGSHWMTLLWDDFDDCGRTDLDAFVYAVDGTVVGRAETRQTAGEGCQPVERIRAWAEDDGWYYLELRLAGGVPNTEIDLLARSGTVWEGVAAGSVTDPGTHPAVFTVGAVRAAGYATNPPEDFSSVGPTNGGFEKPDIAAPDGITTSTYGPSAFYGTSAASPAAAATIALLMSAEPGLSAPQAAERLRGHTLLDDTVWSEQDPGLGAGRVRLAPPTAASRGGCGGAQAALLPGLLGLGLGAKRRRARRRAGRLGARTAHGAASAPHPPTATPPRDP